MTEHIDIGIQLDRDRTVLEVGTKTGRARHTTQTAVTVTDDGVTIGQGGADSFAVFEREQLREDASLNADQPPATLPLALFFERVVKFVRSRIERTIDGSVRLRHGLVSVPGTASASTYEAIKNAMAGLSFDEVAIERRPSLSVRSVVRERPETDYVLGVTIGADEADLAVYHAADEAVNAQGRIVRPELGARRWSRMLAKDLLEQIGCERDVTVEYDEQSLTELSGQLRTLLYGETTVRDDPLSISHTMGNKSAFVAGEHTLVENPEIDREVSRQMRFDSLGGYTDELVDAVDELLSSAAVDSGEISAFVGAGDGYPLDVIHEALVGVFDGDAEGIVYGPFDTDPMVALDAVRANEERSLADTASQHVQLRATGEDGISCRALTPLLSPIGRRHQFKLAAPSTTDQHGVFEVAFLPPGEDVADQVLTVTVNGIPPTLGDDPVRIPFQIRIGAAVVSGPADVTIAVDDSMFDTALKLSVSGGRSDSSEPRLRFPGSPQPTETGETREERTHLSQTATSDAFSARDREGIASDIHEVRADLWDLGVSAGESLDPSDIEILLRELDQRLSRYGIEFYVPKLGDEAEPGRHRIRKQEPAEAAEGTIVDVLKPGMQIDGRRAEPAIVSIANGDAPTTDGDPESVDETEHENDTARSGTESETGR